MNRKRIFVAIFVLFAFLLVFAPYVPIYKLGGAAIFHCGYSKACYDYYGWGFRPKGCFNQLLVSPSYLLTGYGPALIIDYEHCR